MNKNALYLALLLCLSFCYAQDNKVIYVKIVPEKVTLYPGQSLQFLAEGYDLDEHKQPFQPEWEATGGTVTQTGLYTAGENPGIHSVIATARGSSASGTASIIIKPKAQAAKLELFPSKLLIAPGASYHFKVFAFDSKGNKMALPGGILWRSTGGPITAGGMFTAGENQGPFYVSVESGKLTAKSEIVIRPGKTVAINKKKTVEQSKAIHVSSWKLDKTARGVEFSIKARIDDKRGTLVKVLMVLKNGQQQPLTQMPIQKEGQTCQFRGGFPTNMVDELRLVLFDKNGKEIATVKKLITH